MNTVAPVAEGARRVNAGAPLFVDLDGTLIRSDTLWESFAIALRSGPWRTAVGITALARGKAALKRSLGQLGPIDPAALPYREGFLEWLREEKAGGRRIVLATAADRAVAESVAGHLGVFESVLASDGSHNLKGHAKLAAIEAASGGGPFDYAGNDESDMPIFARSRRAVVVAAPESLIRHASRLDKADVRFAHDAAGGLRAWIRAVRPHQWLKNLLVFVPMMTAFALDQPIVWLHALMAAIAMCLAASTGYLVNDLLDMQPDRRHPRKRERPFAAGVLSPSHGFFGAGLLFLAACALALSINGKVLFWLALYLGGTLLYSFWLKRQPMFDVVTLAGLYTLRVEIGAAATGIEVSFWLRAFTIFVFLSLALIKRCGELVSERERGEQTGSGRGYTIGDIAVLQPMGVAASVAAVLVLALYVSAPDVVIRYQTPKLLWLAMVALLVWLGRLWIETARGNMHDDPLVHALNDTIGRWLLIFIGSVFVLAAFGIPRFWA
jgi:4-hydroxybenzoate polyprenyltransferase